ncbi:hypothetical protein ElyMa_001653000 [Elysia marginata]|uniref:Uncharacterized protein n=1 Tax=Elysia marginata TaxID=1093978 RepID=A0AAV4JPW1_9GAST|nr:hypothetical protein ElyMa_001653000 [Elysia marginata]
MHIGPCQGDISQCGRPEFPSISFTTGNTHQSGIRIIRSTGQTNIVITIERQVLPIMALVAPRLAIK